MKITAITQQVKRKGRYNVFVDGKFSFGMGESQLLELGITSGQEISKAKLKELKTAADEGKVFDRTLNLLSIRPRSSWELRDYLKRKKQPPATIDKILNKLTKIGYVNDEQFAQRWVENRRLLKPTSTLKLRSELKQKRIANDIIDKVLQNSSEDDLNALKLLVDKKRSKYQDKQKFMAFLARRGFRYDDIKTVLQDLD